MEADVFESAAAEVPEQGIGDRAESIGSAVVAPARSGEAGRGFGELVIEVVRDVKVESAVAVVVEEGGRRAPARIPEPGTGRGRDVFEAAVAPVAPQLVPAVAGEVEIDVTVFVDVTSRDAVAISNLSKTPVGESTVGSDVAEAEAALLHEQIAI